MGLSDDFLNFQHADHWFNLMPMEVHSNLSCFYLYIYLFTHPVCSSIKLIAAQFIHRGTLKTGSRTSYSCC